MRITHKFVEALVQMEKEIEKQKKIDECKMNPLCATCSALLYCQSRQGRR